MTSRRSASPRLDRAGFGSLVGGLIERLMVIPARTPFSDPALGAIPDAPEGPESDALSTAFGFASSASERPRNSVRVVRRSIAEHGLFRGIPGIEIRYDLVARGHAGDDLHLAVMVRRAHGGFVAPTDPRFADPRGRLLLPRGHTLPVRSDPALFTSVELFVPHALLDLPRGKRTLEIRLYTHDRYSPRLVDAHPVTLFQGDELGGSGGDLDLGEVVSSIVDLQARMVMADGVADPREIAFVRSFLVDGLGLLDKDVLHAARKQLEAALRKPAAASGSAPARLASPGSGPAFEALCARMRGRFPYPLRVLVLGCLYRIALADGTLRESERAFIERVRTATGVRPREGRDLETWFIGRAERFRHLLGLGSRFTFAELEAARSARLAAIDEASSLPLPPEFATFAALRRSEIEEAHTGLARGAI